MSHYIHLKIVKATVCPNCPWALVHSTAWRTLIVLCEVHKVSVALNKRLNFGTVVTGAWHDWKVAALNRDPSGLAMSCQSSTTITWWFWSTSQPASFAGPPDWSNLSATNPFPAFACQATGCLLETLPASSLVSSFSHCWRVDTAPMAWVPRFCGTPELGILRHFQKSVEELTQCLKYSQEYPTWVCGCTFLFAFVSSLCGREEPSRKSWPAPLSERVGGQWKQVTTFARELWHLGFHGSLALTSL